MEMTKPQTISAAQAAEAKPKRPYPGRERIPFPQAGEGCFFLIYLKGIALIDAAVDRVIGKDWHGKGSTCFHEAEKLLLAGNIEVLKAAIDAGLKREGPDEKPVPVTEVDLDEIEWPVSDVAEAALNALAVATYGKRYDTLMAEATAAREAAVEEARKAWQGDRIGGEDAA
ncbi:MAG: hypothetical protein DPW22_05400 [Alphaproteobacteria bacterium]|nr:hypothetical protein [Alphaproteobacteria bacterium]